MNEIGLGQVGPMDLYSTPELKDTDKAWSRPSSEDIYSVYIIRYMLHYRVFLIVKRPPIFYVFAKTSFN